MPSQMTHLAVAKLYLTKHPGVIRDVQRFLDGSVLPDLAKNKAVSHYGVRRNFDNLPQYNREKVNPEKFRAAHDLADDLDKGQYLHLLVDAAYYNDFLRDYYARVNFTQSGVDMYETTKRDDAYLAQKYAVSYADTGYAPILEKINRDWDNEIAANYPTGYQYEIPYSLAALDEFLEMVTAAELS